MHYSVYEMLVVTRRYTTYAWEELTLMKHLPSAQP